MSKDDLTFMVWTDTHFGYEPREGMADIRHQAMDQMEHMAGKPWPTAIGGTVDRPAFILHCGDFVDGMNGRAEIDLYEAALKKMSIPSMETLGNHDIGNDAAVAWFVNRHGGMYYSFDAGGARFVSLYIPRGVYDDGVPPIEDEQLRWIAAQVAEAAGRPMIFFSHATPETLPNEHDFASALAGANVAMMFAGHTHLQAKFGPSRCLWKGYPYVIGGHCRNHWIDPDFGRVLNVARMSGGKVEVADWRWDLGRWSEATA